MDNMKLTPYAAALKMGKEQVAKLMVPVKVRKAKKQAELEMCKLDEDIATKQSKVHEMCADENGINFGNLIDLLDDIAILERKRTQYEQLITELFSDEGEEG